jgi:hypothetical protein
MVSLRERVSIHEAAHAVAALTYGVPLIRANLREVACASFRAPRGLATEALVVFWLSGGEAERLFCGSDDGSAGDLRTAREHLVQRCGPLRLGIELDRYRSAARSLVPAPSAQARIRLIADALLRCGSLDAEQIYELAR